MKKSRLFASALACLGALVLGAGACGPSDEPELVRDDHCPVTGCKDAAVATDAPLTIPDEPLEDWDETGAGPLSGIFAFETTIKAKVGIPVETRQLFRVRILQKGKTLRQKTNLCAFQLPDVQGVATLKIPAPLQALFQTKNVENEGEYLSSSEVVGALWTPPSSLLLVGADLQDPAKDPLPSKDDLSKAIDEDADGKPGVTLDAGVVTCGEGVFEQLYVALRTGSKLTGKVVTLDRIDAKADVTLDQNVIGMSNDCLTTAAQIKILIEPGSLAKGVRVGSAEDIDGNGNVSCPELTARAEALFGEFWAP